MIHDDPDHRKVVPEKAGTGAKDERWAGPSRWSAVVEYQARIFAILWAVAHFAHLLRKGDRTDPFMWIVLGAAVLLLDKPTSRLRLGLLAAAQLVYLYGNMPATDNHLYIMGFVNIGLLAAVVLVPRSEGGPPSEPLLTALPYVRLVIVIAYGAAALAKLNHGFFDRRESCAITMFHDATAILGGRMPDVPGRAEALLPFIVAGAELLIPLLLLLPVTRLAGVVVLVVFHLAMSMSPTATAIDFTVILFSLGFLFLPAQAVPHLEGRVRTLVGRVRPLTRMSRATALVLLTAFLGAMIGGRGLEVANVAGNRNWLWLSIAALVLGGLLLEAAWRGWRERWPRNASVWPLREVPRTKHGALLSVALVAGTLLVLANAASPYLGGKTLSTFAMYSNLQTEAMSSNHYLFPRLPVATGQDDLVLVLDSSNRRLERIGEGGRFITWHELQRRLADDPQASITYLRDGRVYQHEQASENPELVTVHPIAHRFVAHRLYDPDRARCLW